MMKNIKTRLLLALLLATKAVLCQDFHLSQFDAASLYFNPALTGVYFGKKADYKIYSDYRSQWRSLGIKPFSTFYLAYDMPYDKYGFGGYLIHNRNGSGGFNTLNFMPSAAYKISEGEDNPHQLSVGAQIGIIYRNFNPNHFTFDSQFDPDAPGGFDPNISSGEVWQKTSLLKFDANMGVFYKYQFDDWKAQPWGGFSVYHMPRANQSMTKLVKDKLPMRWVMEVGADYQINDNVFLTPMLLYMLQAKAHEVNIGAVCYYHLKDTEYDIIGGLSYRIKDAVILQAGVKYGEHIFSISYDINTSYLNNFTGGKGALEFSLMLTGFKGQPIFSPRLGKAKG